GNLDNYCCQGWIEAFSGKFAESMACRGIVKVAARSPSLAAGRTGARNGPACVGCIDRWAQANLRKLLRSDTRSKFGQAYSRPGLAFRCGGLLPYSQGRPAQLSASRGLPARAVSQSISRQRPQRIAAARPTPTPRTASCRSRARAL